jgi:hypothetical protein
MRREADCYTEIIGWQPIALRLFLTVVAGVLIGFNRGEPAGLRTTLLVCLAASIPCCRPICFWGTAGRSPDSYGPKSSPRWPKRAGYCNCNGSLKSAGKSTVNSGLRHLFRHKFRALRGTKPGLER